MDIFLAIIGWSSTWIIIYSCMVIAYNIGLRLKLKHLPMLGIVSGLDLPSSNQVGWTGQYEMAFELYLSTCWLVLLVIFGWFSAIFQVYISFFKK